MITRDDSRYILPGDTRETAATTVAHFPYSSGNRNISHVAHRARTGPQRSWKSIRNNATSFFLGFRALSCRQIEGTEMFLSHSRLPGRTGGTARAEPTVFNHPSSFFFFFQDFLPQRCAACSFDRQHRWQMFRGFSRRQRMINSKLDWIESIKIHGNSWVYKKNKHPPSVESWRSSSIRYRVS